jgi:glycosyltransferase involved in cell wall biosynthesis
VPAVSICIPAYNYARFLPQAVTSVFEQTWRDFELVVVDNCSDDDTPRVLEELSRRFPALRHVRNASVLPIGASFNRALDLAQAELVKILCADDWLAPSALERSVEALARHPEAALAASGRLLVSLQGEALGLGRYCAREQVVKGETAIERCLHGTNYIGEPSAVLFRRRLAGRGFDESYPHLLDLELWFRLLEQGALACLPEPLAVIRRHPGQATSANARAGEIVEDKKRLYRAYGAKPYVRQTRLKHFLWRLRTAYNLWRGTRRVDGLVHPALFYAALPVLRLLELLRTGLQSWRARAYR